MKPWRNKAFNIDLNNAIEKYRDIKLAGEPDARRLIILNLLYFYKNVFHHYLPAFDPEKSISRDCILRMFPIYVQALEDAKVYMKKFTDNLHRPLIVNEKDSDYVDITTTIIFPSSFVPKQPKYMIVV